MLYLDTSALLKLYVLEKDSDTVNHWVMSQSEPLPVWDIQEAEFFNALRLKVFWKELSGAEVDTLLQHYQRRKRKGYYVVPVLDRIDLMETFRDLTRHTPDLGCRTMDILHVVCALLLSVDVFLSYDNRQRKLAQRVGLQVPEL